MTIIVAEEYKEIQETVQKHRELLSPEEIETLERVLREGANEEPIPDGLAIKCREIINKLFRSLPGSPRSSSMRFWD